MKANHSCMRKRESQAPRFFSQDSPAGGACFPEKWAIPKLLHRLLLMTLYMTALQFPVTCFIGNQRISTVQIPQKDPQPTRLGNPKSFLCPYWIIAAMVNCAAASRICSCDTGCGPAYGLSGTAGTRFPMPAHGMLWVLAVRCPSRPSRRQAASW